MATIQGKLDEANGHPSGFDYLRVVLALSVIGYHSLTTSYGFAEEIKMLTSFWRAPWELILPMFFALSGFLVAGSLERCKTLVAFLGFRALRIVPALAVEVVLSALILGPLLTALPLAVYFTDARFFSYFLNVVGDIHYTLPGLFLHNPLHETVNQQLWTVPFELICYLALSALSLLGVFRNRRWLLLALVFYYSWLGANLVQNPDQYHNPLMNGQTVVMAFVMGVFVYKFKDAIAWDWKIFILAALVSVILLLTPAGDGFAALPIAYMTVWLGTLNPRRNKLILSGDYSYGLYLYGFPLQQAVASAGPAFRHWYINLLIAIPCACVMAGLSWWLVEKPALALKPLFKKFEKGSWPPLDRRKSQ